MSKTRIDLSGLSSKWSSKPMPEFPDCAICGRQIGGEFHTALCEKHLDFEFGDCICGANDIPLILWRRDGHEVLTMHMQCAEPRFQTDDPR